MNITGLYWKKPRATLFWDNTHKSYVVAKIADAKTGRAIFDVTLYKPFNEATYSVVFQMILDAVESLGMRLD